MTAKWITRTLLLLFLVLVVAGIRFAGSRYLSAGENTPSGFEYNSFVMGTVLQIKIRTPDPDQAREAANLAREEMSRVHGIFDPRDPESEISLLNSSRGSGEWVALSDDMAHLLGRALRLHELSRGSFDPALGELIDLWGFSMDRLPEKSPDPARISALRDSLRWADGWRLSEDGTRALGAADAGALDVGGIAKGYGVDRAIEILRVNGVRNALVNLGGEIGVLGAGSNGRNWRVGIQHPRGTNSHIGVVEEVDGRFVATSGDYERYFIEHGRRYHHILDPDTGCPAEGPATSVTVIAGSCLDADAMATAAFVLGPDRGVAFLDSMAVDGLVVYEAGDSLGYNATPAFERIMRPVLDGIPFL